jgi:hypothetical protein
MNNNIKLPSHQQLLKLFCPDTLRVESRERLDLVLVRHGADDMGDIFWFWRDSFELLNDRVDLSDSELRSARADVDFVYGMRVVGGAKYSHRGEVG